MILNGQNYRLEIWDYLKNGSKGLLKFYLIKRPKSIFGFCGVNTRTWWLEEETIMSIILLLSGSIFHSDIDSGNSPVIT